MGDPVTMAMTGAALSGGLSLVKGKGLGDSLKSAAIGGALGGAGGALGQAAGIGGSGVAGAGIKAGAGAIPSAGIDLVGTAAPQAAEGAIDYSLAAPKELASNAGVSNIGSFATGTGTDLMAPPSLMDKMKAFGDKYGTVDNLAGATKMYASMPQQPVRHPTQAQSSMKPPSPMAEQTPIQGLLASIEEAQNKYKQPHYTLLG